MLIQRQHAPRALIWRGVVAAASSALMTTGVYPAVPHLGRMLAERRQGRRRPPGQWRALAAEWAVSLAMTAARPVGFFGLPLTRARHSQGPRPIVCVHGYAMNRANFALLARRLAAAGLGPIFGFEYWTLGKTASAARQLGAFIDAVCAHTGADEVDLVGHSMGGVVGRYFVTLGGGGERVRNLVTLGSPHRGTDVSPFGVGRATKELFPRSALFQRLDAAPPPRTRITVIWSRGDALVPGAQHARIAGADEIVYDDLGHLSLLASRRVARDITARLA